jgi:hypothetical protein
MCSPRCQGVTISSHAPSVLWSATRCLSFAPVGEQVEQPLQLVGASLQVRGEFRSGFFGAAVQRVQ